MEKLLTVLRPVTEMEMSLLASSGRLWLRKVSNANCFIFKRDRVLRTLVSDKLPLYYQSCYGTSFAALKVV